MFEVIVQWSFISWGSVKSLTLELGITRAIVPLVIVAIVLIVRAVFDIMVLTTTFETALPLMALMSMHVSSLPKSSSLISVFDLPAEQSQTVLTGCVTDSYLLKISICF